MSAHDVWTGITRGFRRRCPQCGQGPLLQAYLKVVSPCPDCGHDNAQYPSDDAPPYFTILIAGHVLITPLVVAPFVWTLPPWAVLAVALPVSAALTLWLLPRVKGAVIGTHWAIRRIEGAIPGQDDHPHWAPRQPD